jgi:cytochrome b561
MLRNSPDSWGLAARFFHWLMAALIFAQIALGWTAVSWRLSPLKLELFVWHKSVGMLLLVLLVLRLLWRLGNPPPVHPEGLASWEKRAARIVHALLYVLMAALPMTGWVISSASNIPFKVFWLFPLPAIVAPSQALAEQAARMHLAQVLLLSLLLIVHIGAALRHHYVRRNGVLLRMLTGRDVKP